MKRRSLAARIRECSLLRGEFVTRAGDVTDVYFDKYRFESDPGLLLAVAKRMLKRLPKHCDALAGLEMGGIPVVTMLSHLSGIPAVFVRKEAKTYGTAKFLEGIDGTGRLKMVLVEDVVSTGGALMEAVERLRNEGHRVKRALCVIDRGQGGGEALLAQGVKLKPLFNFDEIAG